MTVTVTAAAPREPLRVVQVGLGGWGSSWAEELRRHPELVTPAAYVDVNPLALESLQRELGAPASVCFTELDGALAATEADVVLVTTSLPFHAPVAIAALERGVDVIVEKPLAPSLEDARAMIAAAERSGATLMVSQNYRHYPAVRAVTELIREGGLGPVAAVSLDFRKNANGGPRDTPHHLLVEPLLLDMSIHHFDLMRHVLGAEPLAVEGVSWNPPWSSFRDPASAAVTVRFDGGAVVSYRGSWVSAAEPTLWGGEWTIECESGCIRFASRGNLTTSLDEVRVSRDGQAFERVELDPLPYFDRLGTIAEFALARAEGRPPLTDAHDNLATLALTLGAIEACRSGAPVDLTGVGVRSAGASA